jgi:HAD superfamily hydrolase (TIGR01458 family)
MLEAVEPIRALLLDIDGVLVRGWEPIPGAVEALGALRRAGIAFRLITNTTTKSRAALAATLRGGGFDVGEDEVVTAVVATASYLRTAHPGARVFVLSDGDASADMEGISLVDVEDADVVVIGGAGPDFTYPALNRVFRRLMAGATLVGMHRNLYWKTSQGWELDGGAFIVGLEEAAGVRATVCGKPSREYFDAARSQIGSAPGETAMVGDDVVNDVLGAQEAGLVGILVRTGKFQEADLERGRPDHVVGSIADVPALLGV